MRRGDFGIIDAAMVESVQCVAMWALLAGAGAMFLAYLTLRFGPCAVRFIDDVFRHYIALPFLGKVLLPVFFGIALVYGSTKTNGVYRSGLMMLTPRNDVAQVWQSVGANVVRAEVLYRCGATEDALCLPFDEGFVFPDGTNHLDRVVVLSSGEVRRSLQDRDALVRFGERLWSRPYVSELTAEHTPSNSCRIVWQDFYANGDTNLPRTVSAELFRNGDLAVGESGEVILVPREIPFPHDGFGQDDDWVRANFTNADEILSVGYADWVDGQVGVDLENGLYKFTAIFPDVPPEATRLWVGDKEVCVTNAGEYVFLLEKGVEYGFGTEPYDDAVEYTMQDDVAPSAPVFAAWWWEDDTHGEWTVDGGWHWIDTPSVWGFGACLWMPKFQATPAMGHLGPGDSPRVFTAVLGDYAYAQNVRYHWSSTDPNVVISSPNARETEIGVDTMPLWRDSSVRVTAAFGTNVFESVCRFNYGEHEYPQVRVVIAAPDAVLLNSNAVDSAKIARGSVSFTSDVETNGTLTLHCSSGGNRIRLTSPDGVGLSWSVTGGETYELSIEGVATSAVLGDVVLDAVFVPDGGAEPAADTAALTVVEVGNVMLPGAPNDGLVISTGTSVAFDMDVHPVGAEGLLSVIYCVRRLRGDGSYTGWEYAAGNYWGTDAIYNPSAGGIYQVQAFAGLGWGAEDVRFYLWEDYSDYVYGIKVPGDMKAFGVCDEEWQKSVRNSAKGYLGDASYAYASTVGAYGGFSAVGGDSWKCNIFVAHRLFDCQLPVPIVHHGRFGYKDWPPLANEWGNGSFEILNWEILGLAEFPQPGMVIIQPSVGPNGHMGIMDFDGMAISAQANGVTRASNAVKWKPLVCRIYKEK